MNELIMPHNVGVKNVMESMKELLALYKKGYWQLPSDARW